MKPLRVIERVAYGDDTPDELADDMGEPSDEIAAVCGQAGLVFQAGWGKFHLVDQNGNVLHSGVTWTEIRWMARCLLAYAAGCPPHWADMGMVEDHDQWKLDGVYAWNEGGARWWVAVDENYGPQTEVEFPTEFDARCWVADRLGIKWGPK